MKIGNRTVLNGVTGQILLPAMEEGPDLTTETRTMLRNTVKASRAQQAAGEPDPNTAPGMQTEPTSTSEETMDENGADVDSGDTSTDLDSMPTVDDGMGGGDDMGGDDMGGGGDPFGGGGMDDGMGGGDGFGESDEPNPQQARLISNLQKNIGAVYDSIAGLLNSLNDYAAPSASQDVRAIYTKAITQLNTVQGIITDLQRDTITPKSYAGKLYQFATARHAYGLIVEELALHFDAIDVENGRPTDAEELKEKQKNARK